MYSLSRMWLRPRRAPQRNSPLRPRPSQSAPAPGWKWADDRKQIEAIRDPPHDPMDFVPPRRDHRTRYGKSVGTLNSAR